MTYADGSTITSATHVAHLNPFRYRGYTYDEETNLYYLRSRYYDPSVGRFLNADGLVSTGQGFDGNNMFSYCENNPVNRDDPTGLFWEEIGNFFVGLWNGTKNWAQNTFGAESTVTTTVAVYEREIVPDPSPVTVTSGEATTVVTSQHGDSSKPISVYANGDADNPIISSSAGIKFNFPNGDTIDISFGLDNLGVSFSSTSKEHTNSVGLRLNLSEIKLGLESSISTQWDSATQTAYTNVSGSGWPLLALAYFISTGQPLPSNALIPCP